MLEAQFWKDWGEIILAAVAIGITLFFWWLARRKTKKELSYSYEIFDLLSYNDQVKDDLQVLYKGDEIDSLKAISVTYINSGRKEILKSDFDQPIKLTIDTSSIFAHYSIEVKDRTPSNIPVQIRETVDGIDIQCGMLNAKDRFTIMILGDGKVNGIITEARIAGISKLKFKNDKETYNPYEITIIIILPLLYIIGLLSLDLPVLLIYETILVKFLLAIGGFGSVFILTSVVDDLIQSRKL